MTEQQFLEIISTALEVDVSSISINSSMDDIEAWDSLGHLTILTALDKATDGAINGVSGLSEIDTLKKLYQVIS